MGVAASCTNCWRSDAPTTTKVRRVSSTEDVAAYDYPSSPGDHNVDARSMGTNAISPSPGSHPQRSASAGRVQHSPAPSKSSKSGCADAAVPPNLAHSGHSVDRGYCDDPGPSMMSPHIPHGAVPAHAFPAHRSTSSSSSGDYELPDEQPQEQEAVSALMFDGREPESSHKTALAASPQPFRPRLGDKSPPGTRVGEVKLQDKNRSSWDRGSSDDDDGPRRKRMGGLIPNIGPTRLQPHQQPKRSQQQRDDDDDDDDDDDYQGPCEDAPALHSGPSYM